MNSKSSLLAVETEGENHELIARQAAGDKHPRSPTPGKTQLPN
jgi:hypothetical protein